VEIEYAGVAQEVTAQHLEALLKDSSGGSY
jgi:hypothetical protein